MPGRGHPLDSPPHVVADVGSLSVFLLLVLDMVAVAVAAFATLNLLRRVDAFGERAPLLLNMTGAVVAAILTAAVTQRLLIGAI